MFTGPEKDRLAIRELIDSYSDAVIRNDAESWGANWAEDAIWRFRSGVIEGRPQIVQTWLKAMAGFRSVVFLAFPGSIKIDGDNAEAVTHTFEHLEPVEGPPRIQAGLYRDKLVRTDAGWRFAERSFTPKELHL